jgi:hypothetical protein
LAVLAQLIDPQPDQAILLDDELTTGSRFHVCKSMLAEIWPQHSVYGLLAAQRIIPQVKPEQVFDDVEF